MLGACSINKVILMGRLTADPELRQTTSGVSTCQFTVAVTRAYADKSSGERQSDFINVVAWRQTAEFICRYFTKGRLILVEGDLRTRTYDDKRYPDVRHYVTEVYADSVSFGETKGSSGGYDNGGGYSRPQNNNYNNGNNNNYGQPPRQDYGQQGSVAVSDLSDFTEVISDSELPF